MKRILLAAALSALASVAGAQVIFQDLGVNLGTVPPTPPLGPRDIQNGVTRTNLDNGGNTGTLNYYTDDAPNNLNNPSHGAPGQTFQTGNQQLVLSHVDIMTRDCNSGTYCGGPVSSGDVMNYELRIYKLSTNWSAFIPGGSAYSTSVRAFQLAKYIANNGFIIGNWVQFTNLGVLLDTNSTYAWTFTRPTGANGGSGFDELAFGTAGAMPTNNATGQVSPGCYCSIPISDLDGYGYTTNLVLGTSTNRSAFFIVGLDLPGAPIANTPLIAPRSTEYAGSPITLTEVAASADSLAPTTYQWRTDGGSGIMTNIPGATLSNLVTTLPDQGFTYLLNYDVIVANTAGSVTSSPALVTVLAATAPLVTQDTTPGTNVLAFIGSDVTFRATFDGTQPITTRWQANKGGGFADLTGTSNATLALLNVSLTDAGVYRRVATNSVGHSNSTPAVLSVIADPAAPVAGQKYAFNVFTNGPVAYWRLSETNDPALVSMQAFDYSGNGHFGNYGNQVINTNPGPRSTDTPTAYVGFETTNRAATFANAFNGVQQVIDIPVSRALSALNTNTVTFTAWIYPTSVEGSAWGLLFNRNSIGNGFGFGTGAGGAFGTFEIGYNWNDNPSTYGYHSALYPPQNQWSFVAVRITPTNAVLFLDYVDAISGTTNLLTAINPTPNSPATTWSGGTTWLGSDSLGATGGRTFNGSLDEVAVFNKALSDDQLLQMFLIAIGGSAVPPAISQNPTPASVYTYSGQQIQIAAAATGSSPLSYQWQQGAPTSGVFTNRPGATASTLTIPSATAGDALDYRLVVANSAGSATSSVANISILVVPTGLWTASFQMTNNTVFDNGGGSIFIGLGRYTGRGILGTGTFWNIMPDLLGAFSGGNYVSTSDLLDDGATHSGIYCGINSSGGFSSDTTVPPPGDIRRLLDQFVHVYYDPGAIQFVGVPDGTYNLALYGIDGGFKDRGSIFTVHAANGDQIDNTLNAQNLILTPNDNSVLFTNVQISGGRLVIDVDPNPAAHGGGNTEAYINAAQLQLVSYSTSPPTAVLNVPTLTTNKTLNLTWSQGVLQTATNVAGPWTTIFLPPNQSGVNPGPPDLQFSVTATNPAQFFRLQVH